MKVKYLRTSLDTSRVGLVVPVHEIKDGESFVSIEDSYWRIGAKFYRNGWRIESYGTLSDRINDHGFFGREEYPTKYSYLVQIIEDTPNQQG